MFSFSISLFLCLFILCPTETTVELAVDIDPNGYVLFCLCMGRLGNQIEHLLGGMAFAKAINRTLILPPFRTYKNVPFDEWFQVEPVRQYHRVILAEDFMRDIAPDYWPVGRRYGFCWLPPNTDKQSCGMKDGNPFRPFWDGLGVEFDESVIHSLSFTDTNAWVQRYTGDEYPVIAMKGAPASFPMKAEHRAIQKYLHFSEAIAAEGEQYITANFPHEKFVGLHLRNGIDWERVCEGAVGRNSYMASPQCLDNTGLTITPDMCLPSLQEIIRLTEIAVMDTNASVIFVATDKNPFKNEIEESLRKLNVKVYHLDPWLPIIDIYILSQADIFIGNCISSFTSFVKRTRDANNKASRFWGL